MDAGLLEYAQGFSKAGFHALVFDYRYFGLSEGNPRQFISVPAQRADWHAAIRCLRGHGDVDAQRIGLWGISFSGGHVIHLAAKDEDVRAVVAQVPAIDPHLNEMLGNFKRGDAKNLKLQQIIRRYFWLRYFMLKTPVLPVVDDGSGDPPALAAREGTEFSEIAGPSWRNEVVVKSFLKGRLADNNPAALTDKLTTPMLIQMAEDDETVSNEAIINFARRCGPMATLSGYVGGHFAMLGGHQRTSAIKEANQFFTRHLIL